MKLEKNVKKTFSWTDCEEDLGRSSDYLLFFKYGSYF